MDAAQSALAYPPRRNRPIQPPIQLRRRHAGADARRAVIADRPSRSIKSSKRSHRREKSTFKDLQEVRRHHSLMCEAT